MPRKKQENEIKLPGEARELLRIAKDRGLTQTAIGALCGLEQHHISKTLNEGREMSASEFINIAKGLELWGGLLAGAETPPQPWIPSETTLTFVIEVLSNALPEGRFYPDEAPKFAHVWRAALEYFAADPDREHNEDYRAGVVPTINRALRDYTKPREQAA